MNVSPFEIGMLVCFGASWPVSVLKTWRMKSHKGKSFLFLWLILTGYVSGTIHKIFYADLDWVIILYLLNGLFVLVDIALAYRFKALEEKVSKPEN